MNNIDGLVLPIKSFAGDDGKYADLDGMLQRQFRALIEYVQAPHLTYGAAQVQPLFLDEDTTNHAGVNVPANGSGTWLTYQFPSTPIDIERPFRVFVWSISELENVSGTDLGIQHAIDCQTSWGITNDDQVTQQFYLAAGSNRYQITNIRSFSGDPSGTTPQLTMRWAYRHNNTGNKAFNIKKQRALYWMTYSPDGSFDQNTGVAAVPSHIEPKWTRKTTVKNAYRKGGS